MEETLNLRKDNDGVISRVTTTESLEPISCEELNRQIAEHQAIIDNLTCMRDAIKDFEESDDTETEVTLPSAEGSN